MSKYMLYILLILISACNGPKDISENKPETDDNIGSIKYLALGDSYTIGEGVTSEQRWPNQLVEKLKEAGQATEPAHIIAKTGWTTGNLLNAIEKDTTTGYNLVSLLIGVNNQYQKKPFDQFKQEFDSLLQIAVNMVGSTEKVFLVSIPDYGVTPFGSSNAEQIGLELDQYNLYMKQQTESQEIPFVNITDISRELGSQDGALATDNLHPSGSQYSQWVESIYPVVNTIVKAL